MIADDFAETLPELQEQAESLMVTPCRVRRPIGEQTDPENGRTTPLFADPDVYAGGCKIQDGGGLQSLEVEGGQSTASVSPMRVDFPVAAGPIRGGDLIEVLAGTVDNPGDVTRALRADRSHIKTWQTAQRIPATELEGLV